MINDILYKKARKLGECSRLYIPFSLTPEILKLIHSSRLSGHPGIKKSLRIATHNYFWPNCSKDVERYVKQCITCNLHNGNVNPRACLDKYPTSLSSFQVVAIDHMGPLPTTYHGNKYLLVFDDHLTKYVEIVPVRDRTAGTVAEALMSHIIMRHSCPEVLLSDNAPEFTGEVLRKLCEFYGIKKCETHPYKPRSNGAVERTNRKIKDVLKTVVNHTTVDWDMVIDDLQLTLNNTVNMSTGETTHFLLYGYQKHMPLTLLDDARPPKPSINYCD